MLNVACADQDWHSVSDAAGSKNLQTVSDFSDAFSPIWSNRSSLTFVVIELKIAFVLYQFQIIPKKDDQRVETSKHGNGDVSPSWFRVNSYRTLRFTEIRIACSKHRIWLTLSWIIFKHSDTARFTTCTMYRTCILVTARIVVLFVVLILSVSFVIAEHISLALSIVTAPIFPIRLQFERVSNSDLAVLSPRCGIRKRWKSRRTRRKSHSRKIHCMLAAKYPLYTWLNHASVVRLNVPGISLTASLTEISCNFTMLFISRHTVLRLGIISLWSQDVIISWKKRVFNYCEGETSIKDPVV